MNKSLEKMREAGLARAIAFSPEAKEEADRLELEAWEYCSQQSEASPTELLKSYRLGTRGIRIGWEGLYGES